MSSNPINPMLRRLARRMVHTLGVLVLTLTAAYSAAAGIAWPPAGKSEGVASNLTARNFYVVFDGSGSMSERACQGEGRKIEQAKNAVRFFVRSLAPVFPSGPSSVSRRTRLRAMVE